MSLPERIASGPIVLRPFVLADAPRVKLLLEDREVAEPTAVIPCPYLDGMAEAWISTHGDDRSARRQYIYAIGRAGDGLLVGAVALRPVADEHENLGYWIGRSYWGTGYATAATGTMLALGFSYCDCDELTASHLARNIASGRVMEKCGMRELRRESRNHRGTTEEVVVRGVEREGWERLVAGR